MLKWPSICKPFGFLEIDKKFKQSRDRWNKVVTKRRLYLSAVKTLPSTGYSRSLVDAKLFRHYGVLIVNEVRYDHISSHFFSTVLTTG